MAGYFDLLWKFSQEESRREGRLKKEPDGFPVEGNYSCLVCGNGINPTTGWYHWGGPRCLICHEAIKDGVIPFFVLKCHDSCYKMWQLKDKFKIKSHQAVKKLIKEGVLKARLVMNGKHVHEYIFLKKENPNLVEKYNPEWKSWQRNKHKVSQRWSRKMKKELLEEHKKFMGKINKKRKDRSI